MSQNSFRFVEPEWHREQEHDLIGMIYTCNTYSSQLLKGIHSRQTIDTRWEHFIHSEDSEAAAIIERVPEGAIRVPFRVNVGKFPSTSF